MNPRHLPRGYAASPGSTSQVCRRALHRDISEFLREAQQIADGNAPDVLVRTARAVGCLSVRIRQGGGYRQRVSTRLETWFTQNPDLTRTLEARLRDAWSNYVHRLAGRLLDSSQRAAVGIPPGVSAHANGSTTAGQRDPSAHAKLRLRNCVIRSPICGASH